MASPSPPSIQRLQINKHSQNLRRHHQKYPPSLFTLCFTLPLFIQFLLRGFTNSDVFQPLFEVTKDPTSHPKLHIFLQRVVGFDSVDDESKVERRLYRKFPAPEQWDTEQNPPYSYYIYYLFANMTSLNAWRKQRNFNTFVLRPHCGEAGDTDHLAAAFLTSQGKHTCLVDSPHILALFFVWVFCVACLLFNGLGMVVDGRYFAWIVIAEDAVHSIPVLPGSNPHRHVPNLQQRPLPIIRSKPLPSLFPLWSQRIIIHRRSPAIPLYKRTPSRRIQYRSSRITLPQSISDVLDLPSKFH